MAKYNLLQGDFTNPIFNVKFDIFSPRPHFIILTRKGVEIGREFSCITERQTQQLIQAGKSVLESFKIEGGILSVHRGAWRSSKGKIHVHFCVDVESYLRVYESRKNAIPNWLNKRHVTKEWKASKDPSSYVQNVRGYPYRSYLQQEVKQIREKSSWVEPGVPLEEVKLEGGLTKVVYHSSHPKIGFVGKKPESIEELQQVLWAIEKVAKELGLTDLNSEDENHGGHVCLYLDSGMYLYWHIFHIIHSPVWYPSLNYNADPISHTYRSIRLFKEGLKRIKCM